MTVIFDEYLDIDDIPLATPGWWVEDLSALWDLYEVRGTDVLVPGIAGVVAQPRRPTVTVAAMPFVVLGDFDIDGDPHDDPRIGLRTNRDYLMDNVFELPTGASTMRTATLHLPDASTLSGDVQVVPPVNWVVVSPICLRGTLRLSIPAGVLATVGS